MTFSTLRRIIYAVVLLVLGVIIWFRRRRKHAHIWDE